MAAELRDFRGRISVLADIAITAKSESTGKDKQEIVREILDAWAERELHCASLLHAALDAEGLQGIVRGASGSPSKG